MPVCNFRRRRVRGSLPRPRGNNYRLLPLALRLGILHWRYPPRSRRLLRLKGYIMERHSTRDPNSRLGRMSGERLVLPAGEPQGSVICNCPVRPKRVCNMCDKKLSRYNPHDVCHSCRIDNIEPTGPDRHGNYKIVHPIEYDGKIHNNDCPVRRFTYRYESPIQE